MICFYVSINHFEVPWGVPLEWHQLLFGGEKGVIGQFNQVARVLVMAEVVVSVFHISVSVWPSVIDGPVWLIEGLNVLESILLSVWVVILMAVFWGVNSLPGKRLGNPLRIYAFVIIERISIN